MLALICGLGSFSLFQLSAMAALNNQLISHVLPSVAAGGRLDAELGAIRRADAEHMLRPDPAVSAAAERSIRDSTKIIATDLGWLHGIADSNEEHRIIVSLSAAMPQFF